MARIVPGSAQAAQHVGRRRLHGGHLLLWAAGLLLGSGGALAADSASGPAAETQARSPVQERSALEAEALAQRLPAAQQRQLGAGDEHFLALWQPADAPTAKGTVILVPGDGESADWPRVIGPTRNGLPANGWQTLSISVPDTAAFDGHRRINDGTPAESQDSEAASSAPEPTPTDAYATRITGRIEAALAEARTHPSGPLVLLGHGTGAYWALRYLNEKKPEDVKHLLLVDYRTPPGELPAFTLPSGMKVADFVADSANASSEDIRQRQRSATRLADSDYRQVRLTSLSSDPDTAQQQLLRRMRGWLEGNAF